MESGFCALGETWGGYEVVVYVVKIGLDGVFCFVEGDYDQVLCSGSGGKWDSGECSVTKSWV